MLRVTQLNAGYGGVQVLWDVSLEVGDAAVALVGPNGAGKTTLLKVISGLLPAMGGSITYGDVRLNGLSPHEIVAHGIVHVPEGRRLFPDMSVEENLHVGAYLPRCRREMKEQLDTVYQLFPVLFERRTVPAGMLSGGEQQMLAIGRGLLGQPSLLMLDEPSLGLAPRLVDTLFEALVSIIHMGVAIFIVEQHVHRALQLCERAYILRSGRVVLHGDTKELQGSDDLRRSYLGR